MRDVATDASLPRSFLHSMQSTQKNVLAPALFARRILVRSTRSPIASRRKTYGHPAGSIFEYSSVANPRRDGGPPQGFQLLDLRADAKRRHSACEAREIPSLSSGRSPPVDRRPKPDGRRGTPGFLQEEISQAAKSKRFRITRPDQTAIP